MSDDDFCVVSSCANFTESVCDKTYKTAPFTVINPVRVVTRLSQSVCLSFLMLKLWMDLKIFLEGADKEHFIRF